MERGANDLRTVRAARLFFGQQRPHHRGGGSLAAAHPDDVNGDMRFDVMLVAPESIPRHIIAAFDASK